MCVVLAQRAETLLRGIVLSQQGIHLLDAFAHPALQQREKDVFLALEIGVKSAARVARFGSDIFKARRLEAVARENPLGGL